MVRYQKQENETDYEYGLRLISIKVEEKPDDLDWEDIVSLLKLDCHRDSLRKAACVTDYSGYKVMQYYKRKIEELCCGSDSNILKELDNKLLEIKKEREKLRSDKIEYNKWIREDARDELFEEKIIQAIKDNFGEIKQPERFATPAVKKYALLNIADCHFGKEFTIYGLKGEVINQYSPEIFEMRMCELFNQVVDYIEREKITNLKVFNLGDSLDGFLRNSQIWSLRYGVVDSAIYYGEYMGKWLNKLSNYVDVEYHQTSGNHGELRLLDGRKGEHLNDNIEKITGAIIKILNNDNPNFKFVSNKTGYIFTEIAGFNIMGFHGEAKDPSNAIKEFSDVYGVKIDYLIHGHFHHSSFNGCGIRKGTIGVGSIMGVDDYSMSIRRTADATASLILFEVDKGKTDEHTFVLN